jgi:hypothetical protein
MSWIVQGRELGAGNQRLVVDAGMLTPAAVERKMSVSV